MRQRRLARAEGHGERVRLEGGDVARGDEREGGDVVAPGEAGRVVEGGIGAVHVDQEITGEVGRVDAQRVVLWREGKCGSWRFNK